jgi:hypothetical protein
MPTADGTIAPSGYEEPTAALSAVARAARRALRSDTVRTSLASMSSAKESKCSPDGDVKRTAARTRRRSRDG